MSDLKAIDWAQVCKDKAGHIYEDGYENGVRFLIMRGPDSLCAYVGVPADHPLANHGSHAIPLDCHGGLTYADLGGGHWPKGFYWYGWDYGHCDDYATYYDDNSYPANLKKGKQWTPSMVREEIWSVTYEFAKLMRLAESCAAKESRHE